MPFEIPMTLTVKADSAEEALAVAYESAEESFNDDDERCLLNVGEVVGEKDPETIQVRVVEAALAELPAFVVDRSKIQVFETDEEAEASVRTQFPGIEIEDATENVRLVVLDDDGVSEARLTRPETS